MLIYVAGPYRGEVDKNIAKARAVAAKCYLAGHDVLCPHLNTGRMDEDTGLPDDFWLKTTLNLLARCDALVLVEGWEKSQGTAAELEYAKSIGMPVYYENDIPPLNSTEIARPQQCAMFIETVMKMYRLHLSKNHDYSPANILGTGEIGIVVRLWDKIARLLNLTGFKIEVSRSEFDKPAGPKHESIDDTAIDAANYAVILSIFRAGYWGK